VRRARMSSLSKALNPSRLAKDLRKCEQINGPVSNFWGSFVVQSSVHAITSRAFDAALPPCSTCVPVSRKTLAFERLYCIEWAALLRCMKYDRAFTAYGAARSPVGTQAEALCVLWQLRQRRVAGRARLRG